MVVDSVDDITEESLDGFYYIKTDDIEEQDMAVSRREFCTGLAGGAFAKNVGSDVLVFRPDASRMPVTATGTTTSRTLGVRFADIVNVKDFGAKGDGVTDDTASIQAALTVATGRGVVFPFGSYCVSRTLHIYENTKVLAIGNSTLINTNSQLECLIEVAEKNILIDGLLFLNKQKGSSTLKKSYDNYAIFIKKHGDFCSISNCHFDNFVSGIRSTTGNDGLIKDIYISGCRFNKYDFGILIDDFDGCTLCGCSGSNVERTRYDSNLGTKPPHLLYVTDRSGTASRALSVTNCVESDNVYSSSFKIRHVAGVTVSGCISDSGCRGYEIGSCTDVSVTGNVFSNAVASQTDIFQCAFWFTAVTRGTLSGNTAHYPSGVAGISFRITAGCNCILITGNNTTQSFSNSLYKNIFYISSSSHITIQGNSIINTSCEIFSQPIINMSTVVDGIVADNTYMDINQTNNPILVSASDSTSVYVRIESMLFSKTRHLSTSFSNCTDCYSFDEGTIPPAYYSSHPPLNFLVDALAGFGHFSDGISILSNNTKIATFNSSATHLLGNGCIASCPIYPSDGATYDLGLNNKRWNNVWVTSGVINDSDQRVKTGICAFPEKVLDAWEGVDFVQFQRVEAIAKKGVAARLHAGVVAQDIKAAFEARGLDPAAYGLFCHDEWDAVEEVRDEDGTIVQAAMEAGDRYSLRYEELLCLEAACQRRRADRLEARLSALEEKLNGK